MRLRRRTSTACPGCGAHVLADKAVASGATFLGPVHFAGNGMIKNSYLSAPIGQDVTIDAQRGATVTYCNINQAAL